MRAIIYISLILSALALVFIGYIWASENCINYKPLIVEKHTTSTEEVILNSTTTEYITDDQCQLELQYCWSRPECECPPQNTCEEEIQNQIDLNIKLEECYQDLMNK